MTSQFLNACIEYDRVRAEVKAQIRLAKRDVIVFSYAAVLIVAVSLFLWISGVIDGSTFARSQVCTAFAVANLTQSVWALKKWREVLS